LLLNNRVEGYYEYNSFSEEEQESRDFGDLVPVWKEIPKPARFGIGMIFGGLTNKFANNIASRLSTRIDSNLANSLAKRAEDGFLDLYRGVDAGEFVRVMENGFQSSKFLTTDVSEAMSYFKVPPVIRTVN